MIQWSFDCKEMTTLENPRDQKYLAGFGNGIVYACRHGADATTRINFLIKDTGVPLDERMLNIASFSA